MFNIQEYMRLIQITRYMPISVYCHANKKFNEQHSTCTNIKTIMATTKQLLSLACSFQQHTAAVAIFDRIVQEPRCQDDQVVSWRLVRRHNLP